MANLKSAKKQARQNVVARERNLARRTSVKTAVKKVLASIERNDSLETIQGLLREAESKLSRAKGKGVLHANTAQRKIGRLAKRVSALQKEQLAPAKK
jgi:small subunit ribosomal protein S20